MGKLAMKMEKNGYESGRKSYNDLTKKGMKQPPRKDSWKQNIHS